MLQFINKNERFFMNSLSKLFLVIAALYGAPAFATPQNSPVSSPKKKILQSLSPNKQRAVRFALEQVGEKRKRADEDEDQNAWNNFLSSAVRCGNQFNVEEALHNGADVNWLDEQGLTPLHYAIQERHEDCAFQLCKNSADPNKPGKIGGYTPLHFAALEDKSSHLMRVLLAHKADPNKPSAAGYTAAHYVTFEDAWGEDRLEKLRLLKQAGDRTVIELDDKGSVIPVFKHSVIKKQRRK
jgi:hypothetical protein